MAQTVGYTTAIAAKMVLESNLQIIKIFIILNLHINLIFRGNTDYWYGTSYVQKYLWSHIKSFEI